MTDCVVEISLVLPDGEGNDVPASGSLIFSPSTRQDLEGSILLPEPFEVLLVDGEASVTLAPTTADWAWRVAEKIPRGQIAYYAVPDGPGPVDYDDLVAVDPETLDPTAALTPAWQTYIDAAIADLVGGAPGALDTLNELAAALGDDANFSATVATALAANAAADATEASTRATADTALSASIAAEAALARNADNLTSGTVADARIAATIARDSEVADAITASLAHSWQRYINLASQPNALSAGTWINQATLGYSTAGASSTPYTHEWRQAISPGTWAVDVYTTKGSTSGIFTIEYSVDGGSNWLPIASNVDHYAATNPGVISTLTGIVVAAATRFDLRLRSAGTKNASSSGYYMVGNNATLRRTA